MNLKMMRYIVGALVQIEAALFLIPILTAVVCNRIGTKIATPNSTTSDRANLRNNAFTVCDLFIPIYTQSPRL